MPNCIYYKKNRERWLICPMNCLISLSLSCSMFFYPKMGELQDMRDYINMLVLDTDMARYNATHPMHESAWVFQKLWGIGCPNKWDMRILQVFFFAREYFISVEIWKWSWTRKMIGLPNKWGEGKKKKRPHDHSELLSLKIANIVTR